MSNEQNQNDKPKEVVFYSDSRGLTIGADALSREERAHGTGQVIRPSKVITFNGQIYRTSDPTEIEFIKSCATFKAGRIKIIDEGGAEAVTTRKVRVANTELSTAH